MASESFLKGRGQREEKARSFRAQDRRGKWAPQPLAPAEAATKEVKRDGCGERGREVWKGFQAEKRPEIQQLFNKQALRDTSSVCQAAFVLTTRGVSEKKQPCTLPDTNPYRPPPHLASWRRGPLAIERDRGRQVDGWGRYTRKRRVGPKVWKQRTSHLLGTMSGSTWQVV